jgi:hypothetical protein
MFGLSLLLSNDIVSRRFGKVKIIIVKHKDKIAVKTQTLIIKLTMILATINI